MTPPLYRGLARGRRSLMNLSSYLHNTNSRAARSPNGRRRRRRASRSRLNLEYLEDRILLSNIFWNVDANGSWDVPGNWKDEAGVSRLPAAGDDVFLDRAAGPFTITHGT